MFSSNVIAVIAGLSALSLVVSFWAVYKATKPSDSQGRKGPAIQCVTFGTVVRLLAVSKTAFFYLVITQEKHGCRRVRRNAKQPTGKVKAQIPNAACVVSIDKARCSAFVGAEEGRLVSAIAADSIDGRFRTGLYESLIARLGVDLIGAFRVQPVNTTQLDSLLDAPAMVAGTVAMLSDESVGTDIAKVIIGVGTLKASSTAAAASVSSTIAEGSAAAWLGVYGGSATAALTGGAAGVSALAGGVAVAGAGGYLLGESVNRLITAVLPSFRGQDAYTIGDAAFDFFRGDDEGGPAGIQGDTLGSSPAGEADNQSSDQENDSSEEENGEEEDSGEDDNTDEDDDNDEDDDSNEDDDSGEDDNTGAVVSAGAADDNEEDNTGEGTTLRPDAETSSPMGVLSMFVATGLGRSEVQRQLSAFEIARGGALGINREKATDLHWDRMLGGLYLKTILGGLEARRNQYGLLAPINTLVALPDSRIFINGFICPGPLGDWIVVDGIAAVNS